MNFIQQKLLQALPPEWAHHFALKSLNFLDACHLLRHLYPPPPSTPVKCFNLTFDNPMGLAAGLDKNADYLAALSHLGFGFIEVGTVTPRPQVGNPRPRLFRLPAQRALINRMGFNNKGIEVVRKQIEAANYSGILGVNIGKNKDTANDDTLRDYLLGFEAFAPLAHYITINISSPNTPSLRDWQEPKALRFLLSGLKEAQAKQTRYTPLLVKIAPDLNPETLTQMAAVFLEMKIDGIIATNTTLSRPMVQENPISKEAGGLSGAPLNTLSTKVISQLSLALNQQIPIIAAGGITNTRSLLDKQQAGARLFQVYTGFIYEGPKLIRSLVEAYSTVTDFAKLRG